MPTYVVTIGTKAQVRLQFEAISDSAASCWLQHVDLAHEGERVEVRPRVDPKITAADLQALREQQQRLHALGEMYPRGAA